MFVGLDGQFNRLLQDISVSEPESFIRFSDIIKFWLYKCNSSRVTNSKFFMYHVILDGELKRCDEDPFSFTFAVI